MDSRLLIASVLLAATFDASSATPTVDALRYRTLSIKTIPCSPGNCKIDPFEVTAVKDGGCSVLVPFDVIEVNQKDVELVFTFVKKTPGDTAKYRFHRTNGIKLTRKHGTNDPTKDLDEPGYHTTDETFKWKSRNKQKKDISFDIFIERVTPKPTPCGAHDPTISNRGN